MRKILSSILALALLAIPIQGAVTALPGPMIYPWIGAVTSTTSSAFLINDTVTQLDEAAAIIQFPSTGTLTALIFSTTTVTTGENNIPVRIEQLDGSGNPSGTLYATNSNGTVNIADTDDNVVKEVSINGGTGVTVTRGDFAAVRIKAVSAFVGSVFRYSSSNPATSLMGALQDYNITAGTAWTKSSGNIYMALDIDGSWVAPYPMLGVGGTASSEAYQSPVEKGLLVNSAVSVRAVAAVALITPAAATSFKYILYSDPTGTPAVAAQTITIDTDIATGATTRSGAAYFTASATLSANTNYVLSFSPLGATNLNLSYFVGNATYKHAYPGGSAATWWGRANSASGAFSELFDTRVPIMGLIVDAIDTGSTRGYIIGDLRERLMPWREAPYRYKYLFPGQINAE